jgi:hypothetical protein
MDFEIGTVVVENEGFYRGTEFTVTSEYTGTHPHFGERKLIAPALPKPKKLTDVQIAFRDDPDVLGIIWEQYQRGGRILISCQGSRVDYLASDLSGITSLSELDALDYISPASEKTHHAKFYVMLPVGADENFYQRVSNFFGSRTTKASTKEVQYNSRDLSEWLMKEHGVLPERRIQ